jgi:hypothetical protein
MQMFFYVTASNRQRGNEGAFTELISSREHHTLRPILCLGNLSAEEVPYYEGHLSGCNSEDQLASLP